MLRYLAVVALVLGCLGAPDMVAQGTAKLSEAQRAYRQGMTLIKAGHVSEAIVEFQRGLASDPLDVPLLNAVGAAYSMKGELAAARGYFKKCLQVDPRFIPARRNLAIDYFRSKRYDLASVQFERLIRDPDSGPTASLFLGMIAEKEGKFVKSADLLGQAGGLVWRFPEAILAYSHALLEMKKVTQATNALAHLNQASGVTAADYFTAGSLLSRFGLNEKSLALFDEAGRLNPKLPLLVYRRALVLERLGRSQEALETLKKGITTSPDPDSLNLLAKVAAKTGDLRLAIDSYRRAARLAPDREDSYLGYGRLCFDYRNYLLALKIVNIGLGHVPNSYQLLVLKGATLDELGQQDKAEAVLRQAMPIQKDNSVALISLAVCQAHERHFKEAADTLTSALSRFPNNYYMHYYLGTVLVTMNDDQRTDPEMAAKAEQQLRTAIRLNPDYADSYFQLAKLFLHKNPGIAEKDLLTCLRIDPKHASAKYVLGRLYVGMGRRKQGQKLINEFMAQQEAEKHKEQKTPRIEISRR